MKKKSSRRKSRNRQLPQQQKLKQENLPEVSDEDQPELVVEPEVGTLTEYLHAASFKGPLPPPALFEHYEKALPGSADRILKLAENEQTHRHEWEHKALEAQKGDNKRGQTFGFIIGVIGLISTIACAALGKEPAAIASASIVITGIVLSYLNKSRQTPDSDTSSSE